MVNQFEPELKKCLVLVLFCLELSLYLNLLCYVFVILFLYILHILNFKESCVLQKKKTLSALACFAEANVTCSFVSGQLCGYSVTYDVYKYSWDRSIDVSSKSSKSMVILLCSRSYNIINNKKIVYS